VAIMAERSVEISHTTILRWVIRYVPEFEKRWNRHARRIGSSWRVDETYVSVRGKWHYLYRAVDRIGRQLQRSRRSAGRNRGMIRRISGDSWHRFAARGNRPEAVSLALRSDRSRAVKRRDIQPSVGFHFSGFDLLPSARGRSAPVKGSAGEHFSQLRRTVAN